MLLGESGMGRGWLEMGGGRTLEGPFHTWKASQGLHPGQPGASELLMRE